MLLDDQKSHDDDDQKDIDDNDLDDTDNDDDDTDEDTNSDSQKKADAKEVADRQEKSWLDKIKSGEKKLDDMPENLGWLKKRVEAKLEPEKKEANKDDVTFKIREALKEERAEEDFNYLIDDLKDSDITAEQEAHLKEEYDDYLSEFDSPSYSRQLKALLYARKVVGLEDSATVVKKRRLRAMSLPPEGGRRRTVVKKDKLTETEKYYQDTLPDRFKS